MNSAQKTKFAGKAVGVIAGTGYSAGKLVGAAKSSARDARRGLKAAGTGARKGGAVARRAGSTAGSAFGRRDRSDRRVTPVVAGIAAGAAGAYFLDPEQGKRRRHLARDKAGKYVRRGAAETRRKADAASGAAVGAVHEATPSPRDPERELNDPALARKVETEIFRSAQAPKDTVSVNVEDGIVYLRGEVSSPEEARQLSECAREVAGVRGVKNLTHQPGEVPTSKDGTPKAGASR